VKKFEDFVRAIFFLEDDEPVETLGASLVVGIIMLVMIFLFLFTSFWDGVF
jgi:hypothetical protein